MLLLSFTCTLPCFLSTVLMTCITDFLSLLRKLILLSVVCMLNVRFATDKIAPNILLVGDGAGSVVICTSSSPTDDDTAALEDGIGGVEDHETIGQSIDGDAPKGLTLRLACSDDTSERGACHQPLQNQEIHFEWVLLVLSIAEEWNSKCEVKPFTDSLEESPAFHHQLLMLGSKGTVLGWHDVQAHLHECQALNFNGLCCGVEEKLLLENIKYLVLVKIGYPLAPRHQNLGYLQTTAKLTMQASARTQGSCVMRRLMTLVQ
ncbi:hypothetical protein PILCRDRAFT_83414 [Piloderma croceum F 1598]|uniref:Uncharacterized protein n=1 Tax=Piloderma croceum (strain F 1598) TaxID=765440 RepID=A0A0C3G7E1_PILCF|nr:hypothetical protein PILCRDRAFT_83414 [Piloderma croceum F 1598]